MSENASKNQSQTDWERLEQMKDEEIDTSDIPPLDEAFFTNAQVRLPAPKVPITIRIDPDVLSWFKSFGKGYQTHINDVLRRYMEAQEEQVG